MSNPFFDQPILNSPYTHPSRYWELDESGQPTQRILNGRRPTDFTVPIPKPKRVKKTNSKDLTPDKQAALLLMDKEQLTNTEQAYQQDLINRLRKHIEDWRKNPNPQQWNVTPTTAKLLQHWRHHNFQSQRPFFCQVEAVETAIWLAEVANNKKHDAFLERLADAQAEANPLLFRIALKLATDVYAIQQTIEDFIENARAVSRHSHAA
jgi:type III restriction enzyme